jgi:hypothetical protein
MTMHGRKSHQNIKIEINNIQLAQRVQFLVFNFNVTE